VEVVRRFDNRRDGLGVVSLIILKEIGGRYRKPADSIHSARLTERTLNEALRLVNLQKQHLQDAAEVLVSTYGDNDIIPIHTDYSRRRPNSLRRDRTVIKSNDRRASHNCKNYGLHGKGHGRTHRRKFPEGYYPLDLLVNRVL
jgi:hypothetical protein